MERLTEYARHPLFSGAPPEEIQRLLACLKAFERSYGKGQVILPAQERQRCIGLVLAGRVDLMKEYVTGDSAFLAYAAEGELFGGLGALQRQGLAPATLTAGAAGTRVLFLPAEKLLHPCPKNCALHRRMPEALMEHLSRRGAELVAKLAVTAETALRGKLIGCLCLLARQKGSGTLSLPLNRTELAGYLNANRSALTRELSAMRREGLLDYDKNRFVLNMEALTRAGAVPDRPGRAERRAAPSQRDSADHLTETGAETE